MAEAFLQVLLDNLNSFIRGELALLFDFKNELEKLSSTFSTIQAVLEDTQEKQQKDKALENWLQKLNAAAYEVDDILDECKTEAARFKQSSGLGRYHPRIVTFRYKVGKRMKEMMEKLDAIAEERRKFHLVEKITERPAARSETGFVLTEPEVYGREKEGDEIVQILINNVNASQELPVMPIIGIGGLGKTTVAQMVFNNSRVTKHFNLKIWVCVSDDFDEKRLIKAILESILGSSLAVENLSPLQKKLQDILNGKRYLLVLDDVWNEDQEKWAKLRSVLKVGARGASVLVTTRLEKVGSIMGTLEPYRLSNLSQEDCWLLFMQRAFGRQRETNPNLLVIGKEIVKKCGGLPLAAKTLGGLLRFKKEESEWECVRDSDIWNLPQDENSILPALRLSYYHLPTDLRQCFAYCAVFPKDTKMKKEKLISLWIAHDFLLLKGNLELEVVGNHVWKELYLRSFFQEVEGDEYGNTYFKMHDLIHDLAISLFSTNTSSSKIRQLDIVETNNMSIGFIKMMSSYSSSLLKKFVSLRVLVLSNGSVERLSSSIGDLMHLRYLDLSNSTIQALPNRLCKLQNLQTLNLNYCYSLSRLPKQTSTLSSLRNLLLYGCPLNSMPPRIGSMTCLKSLDAFVVGKNKSHQLGELQNLNLCGSLSIEHLERVKNDRDVKEANLSAKANLHSLRMSWDEPHIYESEEVEVLEALKPHLNLKVLSIFDFGGFRFPNWMINGSVLKNAFVIEIHGCKKCSCLPPFGELPCLKRLLLSNGSEGVEYVEEDAHSEIPTIRFPSLRRLDITNFPNLKGLLKREGGEQFPMLEEMDICNCPLFVFPILPSVKKLGVSDTNATTLSSVSKLTSVTSLRMSNNCKATSLPEEMFKSLVNLESMDILSFTNLKELPTSLASLNALRRLDIVNCGALESLPEEGLERLTSLTYLTVRYSTMLKSLPEGIKHLTALTTLTIVGSPEVALRCERGIGEYWHKIAHIPNVYIRD